MRQFFIFLLVGAFLLTGCKRNNDNYEAILPSPEFDIHLYFTLFNGYPYYRIYHYNKEVFEWSAMGFKPNYEGIDSSKYKMYKLDTEYVVGRKVESNADQFFQNRKFNSLVIPLESNKIPELAYTIEIRAFTGGVAYRYVIDSEKELFPYPEYSEFVFSEDEQNWKMNADRDSLGMVMEAKVNHAEFISDLSQKVQIFQAGDEIETPLRLMPKEEEEMSFRIYDDKSMSFENNKTPWRIILISKIESNE